MSIGQLGILNIGAGDTKVSFDPDNAEECARACETVTDMMRRGYAIMVQVGERDGKPLYMRAEGFDPATREYIIMGVVDEVVDLNLDKPEPPPPTQAQRTTKGRRARRIAASKAHGVAVAPISGG